MGFFVDCFTAERKHRQIRNPICNAPDFCISVLSRALAHQLCHMPPSFIHDGLVEPSVNSAEIATMLQAPSASISKAMRVQHVTISVKDVVIVGNSALFTKMCTATDAPPLIVHAFNFSHQQGTGRVWRLQPGTFTVSLSDVLFFQPSYWTFLEPTTLLTLD